MTDVAAPQPRLVGPTGTAGPSGAPVDDTFRTPIDYWLAEQQTLTAVERFAQHHTAEPTGRYRDLVPLTVPAPGEQYAFDVDLDTCTGCKACVAACHSLNGLDDDESFRSVGTLLGGPVHDPVIQTVTTACHHCLDPACLTGCPTKAYEKDPVTGIVRHLDDQCIGCRYCTLTCPYEVPTYNSRLGIVRKCDMCAGRLAVGEAPACVQACPTASIAIRVVSTAEVEQATTSGSLVPHGPDSAITRPATRYRTDRDLDSTVGPADRRSVEPAHAHSPLVAMLVLTQLAVGAFTISVLGVGTGDLDALPFTAFVAGAVALAASLLHLGRPSIAWKAVLGLRRSWVSREIVAFGVFAAVTAMYAIGRWSGLPPDLVDAIGRVGVVSGLAGIWCSVMIYGATGKRWWSPARLVVTFALTTLACGIAATLVVESLTSAPRRALVVSLLLATLGKLGWDALPLRHARRSHARTDDELSRSASLLVGPLGVLTARRFATGALAVVLQLVVLASGGQVPAALVAVAVVAIVLGELYERRLFFLAVSSARMPGELR